METDKAEGEKKDGVVKKRGRLLGSVAREGTWSGGAVMKCMDEFIKRRGKEKREEEKMEAFKRSKLTIRSPQKQKKLEEKIDDLARIIIEMEGKLEKKVKTFFKEEFMRWKTEQQEREGKWKREKEELREKVRNLKQRLNKMEREETRREKGEQRETRKNNIDKGIKTEIKKALIYGKKKKKKRKKNIIFKRVDKEGKSVEEAEAELWRAIEVTGKVEKIREIGRGDKKERRMILVKMENREGKIEVMRKKNKLRKKTERIQDDWTWKERAIQWKLEKIA